MAKLRQIIPKDTKTYIPLVQSGQITQEETGREETRQGLQESVLGELKQAISQILVRVESIEGKLDMVLRTKIQRPLTIPSKYRRHEETCLGFRILDKDTISGGKRYRKWYATKQWQGKRVWVYLGSSKEGAEQKIRSYCAKHGISLL